MEEGCRKRTGAAGLKDRATEDPAKRHPRRNSNIGVASDSCPLPRSPFPLGFPGRLLRVYTHLGTHLRGHTAAKVKLRRLLSLCVSLAYIIQLPVRLTSQTSEQIAVGFYDYQPFRYFPLALPRRPCYSFPTPATNRCYHMLFRFFSHLRTYVNARQRLVRTILFTGDIRA